MLYYRTQLILESLDDTCLVSSDDDYMVDRYIFCLWQNTLSYKNTGFILTMVVRSDCQLLSI